jgi:hypothetical protein
MVKRIKMIPCYTFAAFLHYILYPLVWKNETWVKKNSEHFLQLLKSVNVCESDKLASFDVINLFTNVPAEEVLDIIRNKLR